MLLVQTIVCAKDSGALTDVQRKEVIVDTTVQEKKHHIPDRYQAIGKSTAKNGCVREKSTT